MKLCINYIFYWYFLCELWTHSGVSQLDLLSISQVQNCKDESKQISVKVLITLEHLYNLRILKQYFGHLFRGWSILNETHYYQEFNITIHLSEFVVKFF